MWERWVCTAPGEMTSRRAMQLFASPSPTSRTNVALGRCQRFPARGGPLAFAAAALCVGDHFLGGEDGTFCPRAVKPRLSQHVPNGDDSSAVVHLGMR